MIYYIIFAIIAIIGILAGIQNGVRSNRQAKLVRQQLRAMKQAERDEHLR